MDVKVKIDAVHVLIIKKTIHGISEITSSVHFLYF